MRQVRLFVLVGLALAAVVPLAQGEPISRSTGGEPVASPSVAPWSVLLSAQGPGRAGECSGSIIDAGHVLTAAHCTIDDGGRLWQSITVSAGISDRGDTAEMQQRETIGVRTHPNYTPDGVGADVAILTLDLPFDFSRPGVQPIAILGQNAAPPVGSLVRLFGWGLIGPGTSDGKEHTLLQTRLFQRQCSSGVPSRLCAHSTAGAGCSGDSGGGLVTVGGPLALVAVENTEFAGSTPCAAGNMNGYTDLTTPEIAAWLAGSESPPQAPRTAVGPIVGGAWHAGGVATCKAPAWSGAPTLGAAFINKDTGAVLQEGPATSYRLRSAEVGHFIGCTSIASNAGGTTEANSNELVRINGQSSERLRVRRRSHRGKRWHVGLAVASGLRGRRAQVRWIAAKCRPCRRARGVLLRPSTRLTSPALSPGRKVTMVLELPPIRFKGVFFVESTVRVKLPALR